MSSETQRLRCLAAHVEARPVAASMIAPSEGRLGAGSVSVDADVYLANRLTPLEIDQFARDGYFVVENAIPESLSAQMREVLSQIRAEKVDAGTLGANEQSKQGAFSQANTLQTQEPVLALLTNERVFSKVVDILGANIFCYVSRHCNTPGVSACGHSSCQPPPQTCVFAKASAIATCSTTTRICTRRARVSIQTSPYQRRPIRSTTRMCTGASVFTRTQAWEQTVKRQCSLASLLRLATTSVTCRTRHLHPLGWSLVRTIATDRNS
jgi:hypothetical protein